MPTLLWWGRSDLDYARNKILVTLFKNLGWRIKLFHPVSSALGKLQAYFSKIEAPDLIWVPCFRQRDMMSAHSWARKWDCPVVFDPLISAYQKVVFERGKFRENDTSAKKVCNWESRLFQKADLVIADTSLHAEFFVSTLGADPRKMAIIPVGADEEMFQASAMEIEERPLEVLFYGSFLELHGPEVIIEAAALCGDESIQWVLLGDGEAKTALEKKAANMFNVRFEPWIDYEHLPERLARAHILLGIFGDTPKAAMVIPNKVYQSMAMGRPLITRHSDAYPTEMADSRVVGWVPPNDAGALASCIKNWTSDVKTLVDRGAATRGLYDRYFSKDHIQEALKEALNRVY